MRKPVRTAVIAGATAALAATAVAAPAAAAPKNKGTTYVVPGFPVEEVLKPGSLDPSTGAAFGITGNPASGLIKHVGGVVIDGSNGVLMDEDLQIRNFWIDTIGGAVSGEIEGFGRGDLFTLTNVIIDGTTITADLEFTGLASLAVQNNEDLAGEPAGSATVELR